MTYVLVYIDEAGDLGFSSKSSEFFTIGYVFTVNKLTTKENKQVKKLLNNINTSIRNHNKKILEFKFSVNTDNIKRKVMKTIQKLDVCIGIICISKDSVKTDLRNSQMFYRHVLVEKIFTLLINRYMKTQDSDNNIEIILDKSLYDDEIKSFDKYAIEQIRKIDSMTNICIKITHEDSRKIPLLQVADYVASSTQRKIIHDDSIYFDMISNKINHREKLDKNNKINW